MQVIVVGAGIAGITTALALKARGHAVRLLERAPALQAVGAGIVLAPNATRIIERLGVPLAAVGHPLPGMTVRDESGRVLQRLDWTGLGGPGPVLSFARPELHEALARALADDVELRFGDTVAHIEDSQAQLRIGTASGEVLAADALVGADGIRSQVRLFSLGELPLRPARQACWRAVCRNPGLDEAMEAWGGAARLGAVPLTGGRLYVYLVQSTSSRAGETMSLPDLARAFGHFRGEAARVLDALRDATFQFHELEELDEPAWGLGRIALVGDAAHAMTPNQGQGAAMAVEDAWVLADELEKGPAGLADRMRKRRHRRVRGVQLASRRLGALAHWTSPAARALRDGLLRAVPDSWARAQYLRLVRPGVELAGGATGSS